mgnify:CR=1 FL=1
MANLVVPATALGNVMPVPKGEWVQGVTYKPLNIVSHNNNIYIALLENAAEPSEDGDTNWMLLVKGVTKAGVDKLGIVKPDGTTITISEDGTITGAKQIPDNVLVAVEVEEDSEFPDMEIPGIDADLLGGQPPEYFATAEELREAFGNLQVHYISEPDQDLDNYLKQGIYYFPSTYPPLNIPAGSNGWLIVLPINQSDNPVHLKQIWLTLGTGNLNDYNTYVRTRVTQVYSNWVRFLVSADLVQHLYATSLISDYSDFNEIIEFGIYYSTLIAQILNIANRPPDITVGGHVRLEVLGFLNNSGYRIQRLIYRNLVESTERFYERSYLTEDYGWTEWKRIMTSKDVSKENLLINSNFKINQRGGVALRNTTSNNNIYTVDRWRIHNVNTALEVLDGFVRVSNVEEDARNHYLSQYLEEIIPKGTELTLSFQYRNATGEMYSGDNGVSSKIFKLEQSADWKVFSVTWTTPVDMARVLIVQTFSIKGSVIGSVELAWVKLEYGNVATAFIPPSPAEELLKCQRFYKEQKPLGLPDSYNTNTLYMSCDIGNMRIYPTLSFKVKSSDGGSGNDEVRIVTTGGGMINGFTFSLVNRESVSKTTYVIAANKANHGLTMNNCSFRVYNNNAVCLDAEIY